MSVRQLTVSGLPAVALRSAALELVVVPAVGLKVTNLRRPRGREWLWRNPAVPLRPARPGAPFAAQGASGGWDECFPSVAPGAHPDRPGAAAPLPDHGELWTAAWDAQAYEHERGTAIVGVARSELLPCEFRRSLTLDRERPVVRADYALRHLGDAPFHWTWAAHLLVAAPPGTRLEAPTLRQVRVDHAGGRPDLEAGDLVSWPGGIGGRGDAFEVPATGGWSAKLHGDVGESGSLRVVDPRRGETLTCRVDPALVPHAALWLDGTAIGAEDGGGFVLGIEPAIGTADALADAVALGTAAMLAPGEQRRWWVEWEVGDGED